MYEISLKCRCGNIEGTAVQINPKKGTRVVCHCKDCQAFAEKLGQSKEVLDEYGGTDIYQLAPAQVHIDTGIEHIKCLRLSKDGLHRWYAGCCNTPLGNTVSSKMAFVGLIHNFIADPDRDKKIGPPQARVNLNGATGRIPKDKKLAISGKRYLLRILRNIFWWKLTGQCKPHPFYTGRGRPVAQPKVVGEAV